MFYENWNRVSYQHLFLTNNKYEKNILAESNVIIYSWTYSAEYDELFLRNENYFKSIVGRTFSGHFPSFHEDTFCLAMETTNQVGGGKDDSIGYWISRFCIELWRYTDGRTEIPIVFDYRTDESRSVCSGKPKSYERTSFFLFRMNSFHFEWIVRERPGHKVRNAHFQ